MTQLMQRVANIHWSFEKLIQRIIALHEFKGYADEEQLLELLHCEARRTSQTRDSRSDAPSHDHDIEDIPTIGAKAGPPKPKEPHADI